MLLQTMNTPDRRWRARRSDLASWSTFNSTHEHPTLNGETIIVPRNNPLWAIDGMRIETAMEWLKGRGWTVEEIK